LSSTRQVIIKLKSEINQVEKKKKKMESAYTNNLTAHLKALEKEEAIHPSRVDGKN
jgi:hypothetical protein